MLSHIPLPDCLIFTISGYKTSTQSLIFWFRPWSSASEVHFIDPWSILSPYHPPSPWYYSFTNLIPWLPVPNDCSRKNTHPVPDCLLLSLLFCFRKKIRFSKTFLALDRPLVNLHSLPPTTSLVFWCHTSHSLIAWSRKTYSSTID